MTSRWVQQKRQRMKAYRERQQGICPRFAIADHERTGSVAVPMPEAQGHDHSALISAYLSDGGRIKRVACEGIMPRDAMSVTGKGKRTRQTTCYGNPTRKWGLQWA